MVDMSKLRAGTTVRLRNGAVYVVERWEKDWDPDTKWPFDVSFVGIESLYSYTQQGFYWSPVNPAETDIVAIFSAKEVEDDGFVTFHPDLDEEPDFELKRTEPVNLDNLKVGDMVELSDGRVVPVEGIEPSCRSKNHLVTLDWGFDFGVLGIFCKPNGLPNLSVLPYIVAMYPSPKQDELDFQKGPQTESAVRPDPSVRSAAVKPAQDEMPLRDKFAMAALAGEMTHFKYDYGGPHKLAEYCWEVADAMLEARDK